MEQTPLLTTRAEEIAGEEPYKVIEKDEWFRVSGPTPVATSWFDRGGAQDAADELNAAYNQGQQDRWISVADESTLPPIHEEPFTEDGFVLILFQCADWPGKYKTMKASRTICDWDGDGSPLWFWSDEEGEIIDDDDNLITHWSPIPSPPDPEQR